RLVVPDGERVIAGLVMRPHQEAVRFLVVGFALEEPLERADRGFWLFPLELEQGELLGRKDELPIRFLAAPIDPGRTEVGEELAAVDGDRGPQVLRRLARPARVARFASE